VVFVSFKALSQSFKIQSLNTYTQYPQPAEEAYLCRLMEAKKGSIDIVNEVLEACILAYPVSSFIISLYKQYISRGWLTKGQLQGLYSKAQY
jgi:hypothetical protein